MDGVINVYKESSWTSGDVVNKLKGVLHERHIGHGGTLDPDAEGVLPICVGKATRLFDYITSYRKTYVATVVFGKTTDTQDGSGNVLSEKTPNFTQIELQRVLDGFVGKIMQIPPMYSALHVDGKRLYEIARKGETVEIPPREIQIYSIELLEKISENTYSIRVVCGKGTYIRTLCHDIGQKLGCGAYMAHLLRESSAGLNVKDALTVSQIEEKVKNGELDFILPTYKAISYMKRCEIDVSQEKKLSNGNPIDAEYAAIETFSEINLSGLTAEAQNNAFLNCSSENNNNFGNLSAEAQKNLGNLSAEAQKNAFSECLDESQNNRATDIFPKNVEEFVQIWCNGKFYGIGKLENHRYYIKCMLGEIK